MEWQTDNYTEQIVSAKPTVIQYLLFVGTILLDVVGVFATLVAAGFGFILLCAAGFLTYLASRSMKYEYEYIFTNGECEVAKIINKESRKNIYEFSANDVQRVLRFKSDKFQNEMQVNRQLSVKKFVSNIVEKQDNWYAFLTKQEDKTVAVVLELSDDNAEQIKNYYKHKTEF